MPTDRSDRTLVVAMEARDADALGELYNRHAARLLGLAHRILGDTGEAEEVVQETFLYSWKAASAFDHSRGSVLAWLIVATRSRSIDRLRARRPSAHRGPDDADPLERLPGKSDVEAESAAREWETECRAAIAKLPAEQREALDLAYFDGLTHQEIAERTGSPLGTVKTRIRLGLMKLRESMRSYWDRELEDA
ncbi:MAG: sigma-70 family RNA polymerase sigma factor [Acidobacteriota bacterium]